MTSSEGKAAPGVRASFTQSLFKIIIYLFFIPPPQMLALTSGNSFLSFKEAVGLFLGSDV